MQGLEAARGFDRVSVWPLSHGHLGFGGCGVSFSKASLPVGLLSRRICGKLL